MAGFSPCSGWAEKNQRNRFNHIKTTSYCKTRLNQYRMHHQWWKGFKRGRARYRYNNMFGERNATTNEAGGAPTITVFTVELATVSDALWPQLAAILSEGETERAGRFRFERHRRQYVAAHALKRLMLAGFASVPPQAWTFETAPGGKPRVSSASGPFFNLSHCEGLVVCAMSVDLELGVDIEPLRREVPPAIADGILAPVEQAWLENLPELRQPAGFLALWTLKEAFVKATGRGLGQNLRDISFGFNPLRILFHDRDRSEAENWHFDQRRVDPGHLLALAWHGPHAHVECRAARFEALFAGADGGLVREGIGKVFPMRR